MKKNNTNKTLQVDKQDSKVKIIKGKPGRRRRKEEGGGEVRDGEEGESMN